MSANRTLFDRVMNGVPAHEPTPIEPPNIRFLPEPDTFRYPPKEQPAPRQPAGFGGAEVLALLVLALLVVAIGLGINWLRSNNSPDVPPWHNTTPSIQEESAVQSDSFVVDVNVDGVNCPVPGSPVEAYLGGVQLPAECR